MRMRSTKCKILPMDSYQFSLFTQIITFYCLFHLGTFKKKAPKSFLAFMSQNGGNLRQKIKRSRAGRSRLVRLFKWKLLEWLRRNYESVAGTRKKSNYVVNTLVWLRRVTMLYIADPIKVTLSLEIALWVRSYCSVVTQENHCSEFRIRKCPMRNCQFPIPKVTFIESAK